MADRTNRIRAFTDSLGLEIDRLIKTLPGADPKLRGDPEPDQMRSPARPSRMIGATVGNSPAASPAVAPLFTPRQMELGGVWLRTIAAVGLGLGVLAWPYSHECGWSLYTYLGVVGTVHVTGCWACWSAWRSRVAEAHVVALIVVFWGIVLAAEQLLPRIGYAAVDLTWRCTA